MHLYLNLSLILLITLGVFLWILLRLKKAERPPFKPFFITALLISATALGVYIFTGAPNVPTAFGHANPDQEKDNALRVELIFLEHKVAGQNHVTSGNVSLFLMLLQTYTKLGLYEKAGHINDLLTPYLKDNS